MTRSGLGGITVSGMDRIERLDGNHASLGPSSWQQTIYILISYRAKHSQSMKIKLTTITKRKQQNEI
jgi:hypothetical protein